jgi:Fic family protein
MAKSRDGDRHSKAVAVTLIKDKNKRARREARNALRQFDLAIDLIEDWLRPGRRFRFSTSQILQLHQSALEGLDLYAGTFRNGPVKIGKSRHQPPEAHLVPSLTQEMCDYVNRNWRRKALHICAYVMWRMNWIHPFFDGNGRTSRMAAYLVLCVRLGYVLPGTKTIPEQIAADKAPYYKALESADRAWKAGKVDVRALEQLLSTMLAEQLLDVHRKAIGTSVRRPKAKRLH